MQSADQGLRIIAWRTATTAACYWDIWVRVSGFAGSCTASWPCAPRLAIGMQWSAGVPDPPGRADDWTPFRAQSCLSRLLTRLLLAQQHCGHCAWMLQDQA